MQIAVVVGTFPKLSETFVLNHIVGLIKSGYNVTIFATDKGSEPYHPIVGKYGLMDKVVYRLNPHIGTVSRLRLCLKQLWQNKQHAFKLFKTLLPKYYGTYALKGYFLIEALPFLKYKPDYFDIIHAHFGENGNKLAYMKEIGLISSPLIVNFHGHDVNHIQLVKKQNFYKALNKYANALIFNSQYLMQKFIKLRSSKLSMYQIPVGVDTALFSVNTDISKKSIFKIVTVGRLIDCKGIDIIIKALSQINKDNYEYHIIGDGPNMSSLLKLSERYQLNKKVIFHGALTQPQVIEQLKSSNLFILFGITDKFGEIDAQGLVVQEAQSCGVPVIVSDGGGLPEGVINNQTGFIIPEGRIEQLKDTIVEILNNSFDLEKMAINASSFVRNNYALEVINAKILQVYFDTLNYKE